MGNGVDDPSVVAVSDSLAGHARCRRAADAIGARILAETGPAEAIGRLGEHFHVDVVIVDLESEAGEALDALAGELDAAAREARYRSVVAVQPDLLDSAAAIFLHRNVELLCGAGDLDLAAALAMAAADRPATLHDSRRDGDEARLAQLGEEVGRIARALTELSQNPPGTRNGNGGQLGEAPFAYRPKPAVEAEPGPSAEELRAIIRTRRLRERFFDGGLFADPAWDMLLDLMAARLEGREVAVSSLCIAAAVPPTTALRWIKTMTDRGLFVRRSDPRDGRRVFIELAEEAAEAMDRWFAAVRRETGGLSG